MNLRFRKTTACLLLAVWPLVLGLAAGWHTHSHGAPCGGSACCEHRHEHGDLHHHHHGHHHDHQASHKDTEGDHEGEDSSPCRPHRSDECHSCQLLAVSGVMSQSLPILPSLPLGETTAMATVALPELAAPNCLHLRGPPAGMTV